MKTAMSNEPEKLIVKHENVIQLPLGLLGFEHIKQYVLFAIQSEQPFMWLQMLDDPKRGFLVIQPALVGEQVIPLNAGEYPLRPPLPAAA